MEYEFKLTREAKSTGGDRYECESKGHPDYMVFYIPQSISREYSTPTHGKPVENLKIVIAK